MAGTSGAKTERSLRGAAKREAFFEAVEENIQPFARPGDVPEDRRADVRLCKGEILRGTVQILPMGYANSLHYHPAADGMWMVLAGRASFYDKDDKLLGEFGPLEGVFIPRNGRYWFAQVGEDETHLLQVRGNANDGSKRRVDVGQVHAKYGTSQIYDIPGSGD